MKEVLYGLEYSFSRLFLLFSYLKLKIICPVISTFFVSGPY